jgi:hypothetical protein
LISKIVISFCFFVIAEIIISITFFIFLLTFFPFVCFVRYILQFF